MNNGAVHQPLAQSNCNPVTIWWIATRGTAVLSKDIFVELN